MMLIAKQRRQKLPVKRTVIDDKNLCHLLGFPDFPSPAYLGTPGCSCGAPGSGSFFSDVDPSPGHCVQTRLLELVKNSLRQLPREIRDFCAGGKKIRAHQMFLDGSCDVALQC